MPAHDLASPAGLRQLVTAAWSSHVVHAVAKLGIPDLIADGARDSQDLAGATETHPQALYRLLRAAAALEVVEESQDGRFVLTARGRLLRSDVPGSMRAFAVLLGEPWYRGMWDKLVDSVRTGQAAFDHVNHAGLWDYLAQDVAAAALFNAAITSQAPMKASAVIQAYDFADIQTVVDVGGGQGTLIAAILEANPSTCGILFDLPRVVETAGPVVQAVADRCRIVSGDFFAEVPRGGDAYVLATVIHDWADEPATAILRTCRRAMAEAAKLILVEQVVPGGNAYHPSKFDDLHMLVLIGGRERTAHDFHDLLSAADFRLTRILPTASQWSIIEGLPA